MVMAMAGDGPSTERLMATVNGLAGFHSRNTLSPGLTEACEWLADRARKVPGLQVEVMRYTIPKGRRVPEDREVVQVVAVLPGRTQRRILIGGHIDSLNLQGEAETVRAPGANDDASGVAVAFECARLLAPGPHENTLVFVAFSGEEQGLHGSRALAKRAKAEGWDVQAVLNNDTVGCSSNLSGQSDKSRIRVFSEEGEGHNSRELARYCAWVAEQDTLGFGVKLVFRRDRFGRGGDHTPFVEEGFTAVRFIEVFEEYTRQHTPDDLPEHVDPEYLTQACRINLAILRRLANAGPAPTEVRIVRDQAHDTTLAWTGTPGVSYRVFWRDTASAVWQGHADVGEVSRATVQGVNKDDHVFAVGAVDGVPVVAE